MSEEDKKEPVNKSLPNMFGSPGFLEDLVKVQLFAQEFSNLSKDISKGWKQMPNTNPERAPKSWFFDPLQLYQAQGYVERKIALNYSLLRAIVKQVAILSGIINTRCAQIAAFSEPYRKTRSVGFAIRHKDTNHATTPAELNFIKELEAFISNCGRKEKNPYSKIKRDDFETYLRKITKDSLTLDAVATEIIHDRLGIPFEFYATDAATIRYVGDVNEHLGQSIDHGIPGNYDSYGEFDSDWSNDSFYVQVVNGQIKKYFSDTELAYGIRNARTDINANNYGESEIEQILNVVTNLLNVETYWKNMFMNNSMPKGILNFKGEVIAPELLEGFKRSIVANVKGVENAFNMPIMNQPEGLEWFDLQKSNMDQGIESWQQYLIKIICGVYLIDPNEIAFAMPGGQVQSPPLFEGNQEWKLKASRDRGLGPLLKFLAKHINSNIIDQIDDHYVFEFVGLNEQSPQERHQMVLEQLASYKSINEIRREMDLPEVAEDVICNPVYINYILQKQQMEDQKQQMQAQQETLMMQQQAQQIAPPEENQEQNIGQEASSSPEYPELAEIPDYQE